jgi:hypothetical protein
VAKGRSTVKSGDASIVVDQSALIALLDRTADGAAGNFVRVVGAELREREAEAVRVWPVRSGLSKRSLSVVTRIRENVIEVAILNDARSRWGFYAYKIKNSVRTRESLEREALAWSRRGTDPGAQARIFDHRWRQLRRIHGEGARSAAEAGRNAWSIYVRKPAEQRRSAIVAELQADLAKLAQPAGGA